MADRYQLNSQCQCQYAGLCMLVLMMFPLTTHNYPKYMTIHQFVHTHTPITSLQLVHVCWALFSIVLCSFRRIEWYIQQKQNIECIGATCLCIWLTSNKK